MPQVFDTFYKSILKLYCFVLKFKSKREEALSNFKRSTRGAIRKPPSVITWVYTLDDLKEKCGDTDTGAVIRMWNQGATKASQILGSKAQAIKNVMELLPKQTKPILFGFIMEVGMENCPYTEDLLSNKKIFPGHTPRLPIKVWSTRLTITQDSFHLFIIYVNTEFRNAPQYMKVKMSKPRGEELSQKAALVLALAAETQTYVPILDDTLQIEFINKWSAGDHKVTSEIELAWQERAETLQPHDIPTLRQLIAAHTSTAPTAVPAKMDIERETLEKSEFDHDMKKMQYDLRVWGGV